MRLEQNPIIAEGPSLLFTLQRLFRVVAQVVNASADQVDGLAGGKASAVVNKATAAPVTGAWAQGDFVLNSAPVELGAASSKYIITGWRCIASGTPGTWLQSRALTGN